ncbi:MAG TPA: hypothetical protein VFK76_04080, partial [Gaiellaceae bacterium]|nr:hypothetical protein [Gaiellaceae bacterium]
LVAVAACVLVAGTARGAPAQRPYSYDPVLATIAQETLWRAAAHHVRVPRADVLSVGVRCYRGPEAFADTFRRRFGKSPGHVVAYYAGGRDVNIRHEICVDARAFFRGRVTVTTAGAFAVVLHESLHRQGVVNERLTTCYADESVRWGMIWYGFDAADALRGRNLAFQYTRLYAPRGYRIGKQSCLRLAKQRSWLAFAK